MSQHPLTPLFEPKRIAVIGASQSGGGRGHQLLCNIRDGGYAGALCAIHPTQPELAGIKAFPSLSALPERADLVVIAVPADKVPAVLRDCADHGAKFALVVSTGFGDADPEGRRLLDRALAQVRRSQLRLVGPGALGIMRARVQLNASLSGGIGRAGSLAFVSQSGALCNAILSWAQARNIGFSTIAAPGAAADVSVGEVLDFLATDRATRAVLLYVEGVDRVRRFMSGLRAVARIKPVIVVKAGRNSVSEHSAMSQTGAIIGDDAVYDAALRRAGAVRVASLAELFSTAELLSHAPRLPGDALAILTNAGALGVLAADRARTAGVRLAKLTDSTRAQLSAASFPQTQSDNPVQLGFDADQARYARALELCLADPEVDGALVLLSPQVTANPAEIAAAVAERERASNKPVLACFMGGDEVEPARATFAAGEVAAFESPEAAVDAFGYLSSYRRNQALLLQAPDVLSPDVSDFEGARLIVEAALSQGRKQLSQVEAKAVLRSFGIAVSPATRARSADEALVAAQQLGFPVAMKIDSLDVTHKTDVGGVRLNVTGATQVRAVYRELTEEVAKRCPEARLDGVIVEPMLQRKGARELIAGVKRDPAFGPVIAFGPGGTLLELRATPAIGLPPLNTRLACDLLEHGSIARLLGQVRGAPPVDRAALIHLLLRLSDLACELPEIVELDINPLIADAAGAVVLDCRIALQYVPASQRRYAHLAIAPYPRQLVHEVQLADGTTITVRPIRPEDTELEQEFVRNLSLESRRFRFMQGLSRLTTEMLIRFTQLDYDRELALIAVRKTEAGVEELGVARYVGDNDERGCEFAIVVADAWQKRGIASQLMRALIAAARDRHFTHMHGDVLADNYRMLSWMARLGFEVVTHPEDAMLKLVTLPLA
jgi:acetyltransferase